MAAVRNWISDMYLQYSLPILKWLIQIILQISPGFGMAGLDEEDEDVDEDDGAAPAADEF